jgi:hypothetical protein
LKMLNCTGTHRIMPVRVCPARSYHLLCSQKPGHAVHVTCSTGPCYWTNPSCFSLTRWLFQSYWPATHAAASSCITRTATHGRVRVIMPRSFLERTVTVLDLLYSDPLALARGGTRLNDWFVNNQRAGLKKRKRHACSAQS